MLPLLFALPRPQLLLFILLDRTLLLVRNPDRAFVMLPENSKSHVMCVRSGASGQARTGDDRLSGTVAAGAPDVMTGLGHGSCSRIRCNQHNLRVMSLI